MSALSSIKVLELAAGVGSEYSGKLLSDFGAEVIKWEDPITGSPTRHMGPFGSTEASAENSGLFAYLNTNKCSVTFDIESGEGAQLLGKLLERVDVVISDHPDGWLQTIGLDPETFQQRYPGLVLCAITPFGYGGDEPIYAEDINVVHASGWGYHTPTGADTTRPPLQGPGRFLASYEAGLEAAMCIVAALYERQQSNKGQFIDISKQAVLAGRTDYVLGQMIAGDMNVSADRAAYDLAGPAGIFPCNDGFVYIWMSAPGHWDALHKLLGNPEWMNEFPEHWLERECTPERVAVVREHVGAWLATQNKAEVAEQAQQLGLILVPVNNAGDLQASPQYQFRGFFTELDHPVIGTNNYPGVPYKLSATPAQLKTPAPMLGQHTQSTMNELNGAES